MTVQTDHARTRNLTTYLASAREAGLPEDVALKTKHHVLDTIAAMVSGLTLLPGRMAHHYASLQGSGDDASIVGRDALATATVAALTNGMLAHADETDDSHAAAGMHPGCAIVPAALAMAEKNDRGGADLLTSVAAGYDVGARLMLAAGAPARGGSQLSAGYKFDRHAVGGAFGAAVAAAMHAQPRLDERQWNHLLSFASHQASGMPSYPLDSQHVEKAFIFGGMPARNGITAALMLEAGFTGIDNDIEGQGGFLTCFGTEEADPAHIDAELGERFEVMNTNIKKYCVGSPCQAAVDCLVNIIDRHGVGPDDLASMTMYASAGETPVTRADQPMPDLNVRYLLSATLIDGRLGFVAGHDKQRMSDPRIRELMSRIDIGTNPDLANAESPRQAIVELHTTDGRTLREHVVKVRGVKENPMTTEEVVDKARELLELASPPDAAQRVIDLVMHLEDMASVRELTALLRAARV